MGDHHSDRHPEVVAAGVEGDNLITNRRCRHMRNSKISRPNSTKRFGGSRPFYRVFSTVNGGREHQLDLDHKEER